ncbi:MAG: hypothetical protein AB1758_01885 [Candidatus Eremiobacterota bacterium]
MLKSNLHSLPVERFDPATGLVTADNLTLGQTGDEGLLTRRPTFPQEVIPEQAPVATATPPAGVSPEEAVLLAFVGGANVEETAHQVGFQAPNASQSADPGELGWMMAGGPPAGSPTVSQPSGSLLEHGGWTIAS